MKDWQKVQILKQQKDQMFLELRDLQEKMKKVEPIFSVMMQMITELHPIHADMDGCKYCKLLQRDRTLVDTITPDQPYNAPSDEAQQMILKDIQ